MVPESYWKIMDNFPAELELKNVVKELSQGRELAKQLRAHLNASSSSSSFHENSTFLIQRILLSYDQALSMLTPPSDSLAGTSPHTDDSDQDHPAASTKRDKAVAGWSEKIKVCGEAGLLDDGYAWRKYGQKEILGAKYPRGYYRCTYRHDQGCLATKQVQRSDDDPTTFQITYRRKHTCNPQNPLTNTPTNQPLQDIAPNQIHPFNFSINPQNNHIFPYANDQDNYAGLILPNLLNSDSQLSPIFEPITNSPTLDTDHIPFGFSDFNFGNPGYYP